ncbi:MAG: UDP-N-acetylmuramoyl-L-alanyl-D-glutamate--2,6-diaminopimelate ligase [Candidatus Gorgyraea atricola]|nr:UDP-N-acetylmuramoyl-L-alanyl-D-glutamate--2,6-diaminopimelate ligase [Candidatus Gorgyraea atricola]
MRLKKIIDSLSDVKKIEGKVSLEVKGIACNSKEVREGYIFIAFQGARFKGTDFIDEAIDRGACAVILEKGNTSIFRRGCTFIYTGNARHSLSEAAKAFYGDISSKMRLIGITGTNGKTTVTYLVESLFNAISQKTGVIGTINYRFGDRLIPAFNTTPGVLSLYSLLAEMRKDKVRNCILEVSSHSLDQGRVDTLNFDIAVFTNLTSEHMDYHKRMKNYLASKTKLFTKIKTGGHAIINMDDPHADKFIEVVKKEGKARIITYGIENPADVRPGDIDIKSPLIGRHNVYNILASASCGIAMGMSREKIAQAIESIRSLPGRLEKIDCGQDFSVFVDYAHTENGIENALKALKELRPDRLITVFGCGGDRDRSKRSEIGRVSSELSDKIFITSDNPRSEEPLEIIKDIIKGVPARKKNYIIEKDRARAIELALKDAKSKDIVLVAGKGHETYQIFKDITIPFDDREVVKRILSDKNPKSKYYQIPNKSKIPNPKTCLGF